MLGWQMMDQTFLLVAASWIDFLQPKALRGLSLPTTLPIQIREEASEADRKLTVNLKTNV